MLDGTSVDGPGLRTSIYFAGCEHHCPGCHNESTWDFNAGSDTTVEDLLDRVCENEQNVTFSGGDPMFQAAKIVPLARAIVKAGFSIWCYTGFTFEHILRHGTDEQKELIGLCEVLVDGPFVLELRDISLLFRGSSNQRLIDVAASLKENKAILYIPYI